MLNRKLKRIIMLSLVVFSISSCGQKYEVVTDYADAVVTKNNTVVDPFNTVVSLICYTKKAHDEVYDVFNNKIQQLHKEFDSHNEYTDINNVYTINKEYGSGNEVSVSDELFGLLEQSINMCKLTKGYFNPTVGNLTDVWQYDEDGNERFSSLCFEGKDPEQAKINKALESIVPYNDIDGVIELNHENKSVKFNKYKDVENVKLNLGAIAKGYAVELVKQTLETYEKPLMISGGTSSSYALGSNPSPDRDYWAVGIAAPYPTIINVPTLLVVKINGTYTLSVSGDYENCYYIKENGVKTIRHHIINPHTGYPENNKRVISLWSDRNSGILDALSTALFSVNQEDISEIIKSIEASYDMSIEYMYEVEVSDSKVDVYGTETYLSSIIQTNNTYLNEEHIVSK